jgi:hypothetical protein
VKRRSPWVLSVISRLPLILMSPGVYGVIAYTTGLRVREIGIRVALGRNRVGWLPRFFATP